VVLVSLFGKEFSNGITLPHPQTREQNNRKVEIPEKGNVLHGFLRRPINVSNYKQAKDDVNPPEDRSFGVGVHSE
jgi:hypothetical protein